jgi:DNA polymerase III epsilon subunit-like protein
MVLDTETADLNGDIIQLSYIIVDNDMNIVKKVNKYIIDRIPSSETVSIHNITINKLRTKGSEFNDVINTFIKDLENVDYIVGHNVGYDLRVIVNNLRKYEITIITDNKVNNNIFSNILIKDTYQMSKKSLEQLHQELFNAPVYGAHNAINDVLATFECYKKIIASSMQF